MFHEFRKGQAEAKARAIAVINQPPEEVIPRIEAEMKAQWAAEEAEREADGKAIVYMTGAAVATATVAGMLLAGATVAAVFLVLAFVACIVVVVKS